MDSGFPLGRILGAGPDGVALLTGESLRRLSERDRRCVDQVIDAMGRGSQKAQGLPNPVTSSSHLLETSQFLLLKVVDTRCLGILKGGQKHLFMLDDDNVTHEMDAHCCLDFYTHESVQRRGIGAELFRAMEQHLHISAYGWAFDRPSPKLIAFLAKYYGLRNMRPQNNNFLMADPAIRAWGAEFKHYRRTKQHYVPEEYILQREPVPVVVEQRPTQPKSPSVTPSPHISNKAPSPVQPRPSPPPPRSPQPLSADEVIGRKAVVLPPTKPSAMEYANRHVEDEKVLFDKYMREHYGKTHIVKPSSQKDPPRDFTQRQREMDQMAYALARSRNQASSTRMPAVALHTAGRGK